MGKFYESKLYRVLQLLYELIKLNAVAFLCSLPVITVGAAWAGMYASVSKLSNDSGSTLKDFFEGFRKNFKRATLHWLLLLAFLLLAAYDLLVFNTYTELEISKASVVIPLIVTFFVLLASGFLFPFLNVFKAPFLQTIRISVVFSVKYFMRSFCVLFLNAIPFLILYFMTDVFMRALPLWMFAAFALIAYANCHTMQPAVDEINALLEENSEEQP